MKLFIAYVKLFRWESSGMVGREYPMPAGYKTHIQILPSKNLFYIEFLDDMELGDNYNVRLNTLDKNCDCSQIEKNAEFRIVEGSRTTGLGTILW